MFIEMIGLNPNPQPLGTRNLNLQPHRAVEYVDFVGSNFERYVIKSAPHKALTLITSGKLTFDERVALHRVISHQPRTNQTLKLPCYPKPEL